jgi:hypothetical protein
MPFSVFFLEVRWQHEIFANDYETNRLSDQLRDIERKIAEYEDEEARLKTMDLMETMAMELDLIEPSLRQVESIHVFADSEVRPQSAQTLPVETPAGKLPPQDDTVP